ncbi:hypothetical protein AGABI2DRAFT_193313 [Agaricus bisporus var. bisporus H97]|uniref:hypothetical protein n=1 Tax=Agaricus bisporus var. bisporus (strain H97 / ATCC MYA-4626 / FGSC 10389) TaxID=936046 RepID=UPI00029F64FC|nr:hypothetical protein AGABI2DRAFT_193313 [Agaricus bisporus var. bisporus H97]EKV46644.1 hypothetical protein AGABI2DRAFT_193313 [Agaricus bisporus var. bisporus H97]
MDRNRYIVPKKPAVCVGPIWNKTRCNVSGKRGCLFVFFIPFHSCPTYDSVFFFSSPLWRDNCLKKVRLDSTYPSALWILR